MEVERFKHRQGWREVFSPWRTKRGGDREAAGADSIPYMTTFLLLRMG
jgi:hypothetical protein